MKNTYILFFVISLSAILFLPSVSAQSVPDWIKNTAGWWAEGQIDDQTFVNGIQFLIKEDIIQLSNTLSNNKNSELIPEWIKNTAGWWAANQISEIEFLNAIEFLIETGIIIIETSENEKQFIQNPMELLNDLSFLKHIVIPDNQSKHFINSDGFRSPEISENKPSNTFRVFVVGGSTTYGAGVNDANTIPSLLQKKIDEKNYAQTIEVINAGFQGARSIEEVKLVKEKLLDFAPDIIIVYDGYNDVKSFHGENIDPEDSKFSEKQSSPTKWKTNWIEICKFGEAHNFKTIVTLQPFLGVGNKLLTDNEYAMQKGYGFSTILNEYYVNYADQLDEINQNCTAAYDLRYVFDTYLGSIYWDYVHVGNNGNEIVAKIFYEIVNDNIKNNNNGKNNINKFSSSAYNVQELLMDKIRDEKIELSNKDHSDQNLVGKNFFADHIKDTDFSNANLVGADFSFAKLDNVNFTNADLTGADFSSATIINSDFTGADLTNIYAATVRIQNSFFHNTNLSGAFLVGAEILCGVIQEYDSQRLLEMSSKYECINSTNFENANLSQTRLFNLDLYNSKVENTKFIMASVTKSIFPQEINADFSGSTLPATQFHGDLSNVIFSCHEFWCSNFSTVVFGGNLVSGTDLSYTDLSKRDLSKMVFNTISGTVTESNCGYQCLQHREFFTTKLNFSNLSKSIFKGNNLVDVDFIGADLTFSDLSDTNMSHANLTGANLSGANLSGANLSGANLENTNLKGAVLDNAVLSNANLKCINHQICLNDY